MHGQWNREFNLSHFRSLNPRVHVHTTKCVRADRSANVHFLKKWRKHKGLLDFDGALQLNPRRSQVDRKMITLIELYNWIWPDCCI